MKVSASNGSSLFARLVGVAAILSVHIVALLATTFITAFGISSYVELFERFETALPPPTILAIRCSNLAVAYWYLIVLVILLNIVVVALLSVATTRRWPLTFYSHALLAMIILWLVFVCIALAIPVGHLATSIPAP